jgi:hypothetical protein
MRRSLALAAFSLVILSWAATSQAPVSRSADPSRADFGAKGPGEMHSSFPDCGFVPPKDQYEGKLFHLRQDYPDAKPGDDALAGFLKIPFDQNRDGQRNWKKYLIKVRDYCFEGNIDTDPRQVDERDYGTDWNLEANKKREWFHAPLLC